MHAIDKAIFRGTLTDALLEEHAARPLPDPGASYWGDRMREGHAPERAAVLAARDSGHGADQHRRGVPRS